MDEEIIKLKAAFYNSIPMGSDEWGSLISKDIAERNFCHCNHPRVWHKEDTFCGGWKGTSKVNDDSCECILYHPKDNLKYLEYQCEKKTT